jgi:hypothetical protein
VQPAVTRQKGGKIHDVRPEMTAGSRDDPFAGAYSRWAVPVTAAEAALTLRDDDLEAVWRALPDGSVQVARPCRGRVELYEVPPDGVPRLVDASPRSSRKVAAELMQGVAGVGFIVAFLATWVYRPAAWAIGASLVLYVVSFLLRWRSHVRPWVRERFGSDDEWSKVPWLVDGRPPTGNQMIAMSGIVARHSGNGVYRTLSDDTAELLTRELTAEGFLYWVHRIDHLGNADEVNHFGDEDEAAADADRWLDDDRELSKQNEWHKIMTYALTTAG